MRSAWATLFATLRNISSGVSITLPCSSFFRYRRPSTVRALELRCISEDLTAMTHLLSDYILPLFSAEEREGFRACISDFNGNPPPAPPLKKGGEGGFYQPFLADGSLTFHKKVLIKNMPS